MNLDARDAFRQAEIRAMNEAATAESDARDQARSDFRRREIVEMNTGDVAMMAKLGLLSLSAVIVFVMVMKSSRSKL